MKKRYWLILLDLGLNCVIVFYDVVIVVFGVLVDLDFCVVSEIVCKKRKINGFLEGGMNKEE